MTKVNIPHNAYVFVGDGRKAWCCATKATQNSSI